MVSTAGLVAAVLCVALLAALILAGAWLLSWPLALLWRKGRKT